MDEKEGEGGEVREGKKLKESLQIYVYRLEEEKLLVPLAPFHEKGKRNRRRQARRRATLTTAVASCRVFGIAFVISLNASLYLFFSKLDSVVA